MTRRSFSRIKDGSFDLRNTAGSGHPSEFDLEVNKTLFYHIIGNSNEILLSYNFFAIILLG